MPKDLRTRRGLDAALGEAGRDNLQPYLATTPFAEAIWTEINEKGYVVLPSIFSAAECDEAHDRMWQFVEKVSPGVRRADRSTWTSNAAWPCAQRDSKF